jgi:hypothetical protein
VFLVLMLGGGGFLLYRMYPAHHPLAKKPNFVDLIFANNLVVFAARIVLLSAAGVLAVAAVFVVVSFWKRAQAGHWMSRFGPFETQALQDLTGLLEQWQGWWQEEFGRRTELEERVEQSDVLIQELQQRYEEAVVEIARLRGDQSEDAP